MTQPTRKEPPEGGWGILVCFGLAMPFTFGLGVLPSFGLIFGDFLEDIGVGTRGIALLTSVYYSAFSFAGLLTSMLYKRFTFRAVGLCGGILYFLGSIIQIYVTSTWELLLAFSVIQGFGFGLIVPTSYTVFNGYFVKRRFMMMSFAQSLIGAGTMFYPVIIHKLNEWYGFRGCLMVLAAINSHAILGMLIMQPVEWHMKHVKVPDEEMIVLNSIQPLEDVSKANGSIRKTSMEATDECLMSTCQPTPSSKGSCWKAIVNFLDLTLLKDPIYLNIVLGISFALYSDLAFFTLQPLYLFELGYTKGDTATVIAIGAAADLVSRIFLAFSAVFIVIPARLIYLAGAFFTVISRFAFLEVRGFIQMSIITAIMGFLRTWIHVPLPLVFGEFLPKERFASGYGLFMFLQGNITFIIGPFLGYIRDVTNDYVFTFHCLNLFMALCAVPWLIEMIYLKKRNRKSPEALEETAMKSLNGGNSLARGENRRDSIQ